MNRPELKSIADSVSVCHVKTDRFKTCKICISMALPLDGDIAAKAVLPYMLRRSCKKYPSFSEFNGRLDELYGAAATAFVRKQGEAQVLGLTVTSIDDRFALDGKSVSSDAAELLCDMLFDPDFDENGTFKADDLETEKRLLLERMISEDDDKRAYSVKRCQEIMCENEAFSRNRFGTESEIQSLTPDRVFAAWQEVLGSAVIRIVSVSSGSADEISNLFSQRFEKIDRAPRDATTQFIPDAKEVKYIKEEQKLKQGTLVLGFRCGMTHKDEFDPAMSVMADIFGGGTYSKLFSVVREKMSLCYFCSARLDRSKGIMLVASGIETANEEKAKNAILDQLDEMKNGSFTKDDFDASIRSVKEGLLSALDSPEVWYSNQILNKEIKTPQERLSEFESVKFEDIREMAQKITLDTVFMLAGTGEEDDGE
ncbi:MAG: insulinase family protein [Clostridia bacterium]|nr:insulinase family protein [Clostridia bacterium]